MRRATYFVDGHNSSTKTLNKSKNYTHRTQIVTLFVYQDPSQQFLYIHQFDEQRIPNILNDNYVTTPVTSLEMFISKF